MNHLPLSKKNSNIPKVEALTSGAKTTILRKIKYRMIFQGGLLRKGNMLRLLPSS